MGYQLIASESTVQVLSPTVVNDVLYCTVESTQSGVIASTPIPADANTAVLQFAALLPFVSAIDEVMNHGHVIAGVGRQSIDDNGLIQDNVAFTVQYIPQGWTTSNITAEVLIPNTVLLNTRLVNILGGQIPVPDLTEAFAMIDAAYQSLAGGASG